MEFRFPFVELQNGKQVAMEFVVEAESFEEAIQAAHDELERRSS
jgi:hypothetical protein